MTTKYHSIPPDSTGASALAQFPPDISLESPVLGSVITLPEDPLISYAVYTLTPPALGTSSDPFCVVEQARKRLVRDNHSRSLVDSLLPSVHVRKEQAVLYVFALGSTHGTRDIASRLKELVLDGLTVTESFTFTPSGLYPCSTTCASLSGPCSTCLSQDVLSSLSSPQANSGFKSSAATLLPRHPLRRPFTQFIEAIRDRLIDDVSRASAKPSSSGCPRLAVRLRDGFLLFPIHPTSEWGTGWEHFSTERPLMYCHLDINLSRKSSTSARLLIHPILQPTYHLPLGRTLPMPAGTPILLLPYGTPAYYLNIYNGPTNALIIQFDEALAGLGTGEWKDMYQNRTSSSHQSLHTPRFVIAWLAVQNKQGEEKGLPIIWPASLCLSYIPHAPSLHSRSTLRHLPELPSQLQASPPPPAPYVPLSLLQKDMKQTERSSSVAAMSSTGNAPRSSIPASPSIGRRTSSPMPKRIAPLPPERSYHLSYSPTTDSLRAFKALTLSSTAGDLPTVASEVSGYVEAVARERERERERMKKEKEKEFKMSGATPSKVQSIIPIPIPTARSPTPVVNPYPASALDGNRMHSHTPQAQTASESPTELLPAADIFGDLPSQDTSMPMDVDFDVSVADVPPPVAPQPIPVTDPISNNFDPYNTFDSGWPQPQNDFLNMNMNMDYGMGFNMNIGSMGNGATAAGPATTNFGLDDDFDAFTDDDFKFFDNPSATNAEPPTSAIDGALSMFSGFTPGASSLQVGFSPPVISESTSFSYMAPISTTLNQSQPSPWIPSSFRDVLSPTEAPQTLPHMPSPVKTPISQSVPSTPAVQLSDQYVPLLANRRKSGQFVSGSEVFEPIPFATSHSAADNKYVTGKFALPSPPDEEDRTEEIVSRRSSVSAPVSGWKVRYKNITDPGVGIVRKLIGSKRKAPAQGGRQSKLSTSWEREHEEWTSSSPTAVDADETKTDSDMDDEPWGEDDETAHSISRPITPPPPYVPLGPTLLQTYFHHSRLLPLSRPLLPQSVPDSTTNNTSAPLSVPTPVSPAAVFGAASEKTKSLEAAVQILVKEVTENRLLAHAWNACAMARLQTVKLPSDVWQVDVRRTVELCADVKETRSPVDLQCLFSGFANSGSTSATIQSLKPPILSLAKSESVIQVLPTALLFWEKLGLCPRAGEKNVTAFVFFDSRGVVNERQAADWLAKVSAAYKARRLGTHTPGEAQACSAEGVVPVQFESFRKMLVAFIESLPHPDEHLVFYVAAPPAILNLTSPVLRQVLSAVKRGLKSHLGPRIVFHFVPEDLILDGIGTFNQSSLDSLVDAVYNRILRPVDRVLSQTLFADAENNVKFIRESHTSSLDVLERHSMLHVGYQVTPDGKWLLAACIDQRGEAHDLKAWLAPDDADEHFAISNVWSFALAFATKASLEWRIVVSKFGPVLEKELDAWIDHLDSAIPNANDLPPMQVFVLSAEDAIWTFLARDDDLLDTRPTSPNRSGKHPPGTILRDVSSTTFALFASEHPPPYRRPSLASFPQQPYIAEAEAAADDTEDHFMTCSLASSTLLHVPAATDYANISMLHLHLFHIAHSSNSSYNLGHDDTMRDITRNFYELSELAKARWGTEKPTLPFHLATLETMKMVLDRGDAIME
ncbi:unnamed protein product [Somion occarium]|uniref:Mediator of RNA polymerase II transcription subunit 13 n=1 Tax=Somion occarium TaxID=3059160 RepID=A0ABP1D6J1_9APHY